MASLGHLRVRSSSAPGAAPRLGHLRAWGSSAPGAAPRPAPDGCSQHVTRATRSHLETYLISSFGLLGKSPNVPGSWVAKTALLLVTVTLTKVCVVHGLAGIYQPGAQICGAAGPASVRADAAAGGRAAGGQPQQRRRHGGDAAAPEPARVVSVEDVVKDLRQIVYVLKGPSFCAKGVGWGFRWMHMGHACL
eukprot:364834-Chlamydomonas_euryale.AAC.3